jgi:redox-sensitive bicupin YhaK (pirin superfamily)
VTGRAGACSELAVTITSRAIPHHGLLLINNDDVVSPGTGFETHPHQDMEIVTWVLQARWSTGAPPVTPGSSTRGSPSV